MRWLLQICLLVVALVGSAGESFAGSNLPKCPTSGYFHNCFGTETYRNGNKYVGEFRDGKYNGQGILTFANGHKYVGAFKNGKYNGQGTYTFADGTKYVGEYKDDKRNGQGTLTVVDGAKYVGFRPVCLHYNLKVSNCAVRIVLYVQTHQTITLKVRQPLRL